MAEYVIAHVGHTQKHDEHVCWWRPESKGYTICIDKAGRYSKEEAENICRHSECVAVELHHVEPLAKTTPYYRKSDGRLAKLYDGGPHRPVENAAQTWKSLIENRLLCEGRTPKATPMSPKNAWSIYLDDLLADQG